MLNITLICIGKLKEAYLRDAVSEYAKRLTSYCKLNIVELDETRMPDDPSISQITAALADEGKRILSKIPSNAHVIAMCIEGSMLSSEDLGQYLNKTAVNGSSHIVLVIGGSWGLFPDVKKRADFHLSLSRMTFTHQMSRMLILEQLYRAFQINNQGKYHK